MVLFPRDNKKPKAGEATKEERSNVQQQTGQLLPFSRVQSKQVTTVDLAAIQEARKVSVVEITRTARTDAKLVGQRAKKKKEKEEAAAAKVGK